MTPRWTDHPYHYDGYLWLLKPTVVFSATLDYTSTVTDYQGRYLATTITQRVYVDTVLAGAIADVREGMTLCLGTTPGAYDLGRVRVRLDASSGDTYLAVWSSTGLTDGAITPQAGAYITVWKLFGPWMKPPYYGDGSGYYDGQVGPTGTVYQPYPIANIQAGRNADFVDPATEKLRVTLNGAASFAAAADAVLGAYQDVTGDITYLYASSESGSDVAANAVDGDTGTAWRAASWDGESLYWDVDADIKRLRITCETATSAPASFRLYRRQEGVGLQLVMWVAEQDGWTAGETRSFPVDFDYPGVWGTRYQLLIFFSNSSSASIAIAELGIDAEDRSSGCYQWDLDGGTLVSGALTDEEIVADFDPGFYYVRLEVTDTHSHMGFCHLPVLAVPQAARYTLVYSEIDTSGSTQTARTYLSTNPPQFAFWGDPALYWSSQGMSYIDWLRIDFPAAHRVGRYAITAGSGGVLATLAPYDFILQGSSGGSWTDLDTQTGITFTDGETRTFTVAAPGEYLSYRLYMTENNSTTAIFIVAELALYEVEYVRNDDEDITPLAGVVVTEHRMGFDGQRMTFQVHDAIPLADYPDGTLALYFEREVIAGEAGSISLDFLVDDTGDYLVTSDGDYLVASAGSGNPLKFWGFLAEEPTRIEGTATHTRTTTQLQVLDVGGWLQRLPGFPLTLWRAEDALPSYVQYMPYATIDRAIYLLAKWLTTAAEITTFVWSGQRMRYDFPRIDIQGGTLWEMLDGRAQAIAHRLTCDRHGQLAVLRDWPLTRTDGGPRQLSLGPEDIASFEYTRTRPPRYHWHRGEAIYVSRSVFTANDFELIPAYAIAPGEVPGQGTQASEQGEQLVLDAGDLAERTGQRAALDNADHSRFRLRLAHAADVDLDPARLAWIDVTITAAVAAQRGVTWTHDLFMPYAVTIEHLHETGTKRVWVDMEQRALGQDAVIYEEPL